MKKHNTAKVVLITILVLLLFTWIFPAAYYSGQVVDQGRVQMGLSELFNYPLTAVSYFGHIAVFIILVGSFYGILYKIPAYRTFLDKFVSKFEGKEKILLAIISVIIALAVSCAGLQIGFILFVPLLVSLILLMGYDKIVSALVIVGSASVGLIGSTYSLANLNSLLSALSLKIDYQIGVRFVILLVGVVLLLFNTFMYIKTGLTHKKIDDLKDATKKEVKEEIVEIKEVVKEKAPTKNTSTHKKSTSQSSKSTKSSKTTAKRGRPSKNANKAALREEDIIVVKESVVSSDTNNYLVPSRVESTHKVWPFVVFFTLLFILTVMAFINWGEGGFGVTLFDNLTTKFNEFELFGFPIFAKVYGGIASFGNWTIIDLFLPMTLVILLLSVIYKIKLDDIFDGFVTGAQKALGPAFISILVYMILVVVTYHPFQLTFYKAILGLTSGFNIATTVLVTLLSAMFNVDPTYVFQALLPYYTSVVTNTEVYPLVGIISQSMYGLTTLFIPSSLVLMCSLAYLKISYKEWLKNSWKLILELFVILLIVFIILALI